MTVLRKTIGAFKAVLMNLPFLYSSAVNILRRFVIKKPQRPTYARIRIRENFLSNPEIPSANSSVNIWW